MTAILDEAAADLLDEALGLITDEAGVAPAVVTPAVSGGWWQLLDIREQRAQEFDFWADNPPMACPLCGEPLRNSPPADSGSSVDLYCPFDGWQFPRDWTRPMRA